MNSVNIIDEKLKRDEFRQILFTLAESQDILRENYERAQIYKRLEKIYWAKSEKDRFRHFYSDIFSVLVQIKQGDKPGSIDIIGQNLGEIRNGYQAINHDDDGKLIDISDNIRKLYDHVSLELARLTYNDSVGRDITEESKISFLKAHVAELKSNLNIIQENLNLQKEDLNLQLNKVKKSLNGAQKEYISILGIFAAIVLGFTGGMTFSSSVLENINKSSVYRLIIVAIIIGFVFYNLVYLLLDFISKMTEKNNMHKPIIWNVVNAILIIGIAFTCLAYKYQWFEREENITRAIDMQQENNIDENTLDKPLL